MADEQQVSMSQAEYRASRQGGGSIAPEAETPDETALGQTVDEMAPFEGGIDEGEESREPEHAEDSAEAAVDEEAEPPRRQGRRDKRIAQLTRQRQEAYELAEAERRARLSLEARLSELEHLAGVVPESPGAPALESAQDPEPERPNPDDYDTTDDYIDAVATYRAQMVLRGERGRQAAEQQIAQAQSEVQRVAQQFEASVEEARTKYEDYDEVAESIEVRSPALNELVVRHPQAGDLVYFFGTHPEELNRVQAMTDPYTMAYEIGRIAASASDEPATPPANKRPRREAPPPPLTPPRGDRGGTGTPKRLEELSYRDYAAERRKGRGT